MLKVQELMIFLSKKIMNKIIIKNWFFFKKKDFFFVVKCATWHTVRFGFFFNGKLTEGLKSKVLQSAGPMSNKKKRMDQCQNWAKVQGLNTHLQLEIFP